MDLVKAEAIAKEKMNEHGLSHWEFGFDDSVRRRGACHWSKKLITLSGALTEVLDEAHIVNTILHEIAHALTPGCHHDKVWRKKAIEIGCDGSRCATDEATIQAPFKGKCNRCGKVIERHRRKRISCGSCSGGSFNKAFLFKWTRA